MTDYRMKATAEFPPQLVAKAKAKYRQAVESFEDRKARDFRWLEKVYAVEAGMLEVEEEWVEWWLNLRAHSRELSRETVGRLDHGRP